MASYTYNHLSNDPFSFRLLRLLPSSDSGSMINCEVFHDNVTNTDRAPYEALSYTWGDTSHLATIKVDGCNFPVTINLEFALRALRDTANARVLWIDAICINQADIKEQGEQVRIMWDIYSSAERVVVWLGPEEGDSDIAMDNIARQESHTRLKMRRKKWNDKIGAPERCPCATGDWKTRPPRIGVANLLRRRWFSRIWVLQEIAAAKSAVVICGNKSVDANVFSREMVEVASVYKTLEVTARKIRPALTLMAESLRDLEAGSTPLVELIERFRSWDATKLVDKVYALLRFSSDASSIQELQPDYSVTPKDLARRVVHSVLPGSSISMQPQDGNGIAFEVDGFLLGALRAGGSWSIFDSEKSAHSTPEGGIERSGWNGVKYDNETVWNFTAYKNYPPNAVYNSVALTLFQDDWEIAITNERRLPKGGFIVLLQGASRPTALRLIDGEYIVDMLATPKPRKQTSVDKKTLSGGIFSRQIGWSEAIEVLSIKSEGLMRFKLFWDPYRQPFPYEISKHSPEPNDFLTHWDAEIESLKESAEMGSGIDHDCKSIMDLHCLFMRNRSEIEAGTSNLTMTIHKAAYQGLHDTIKLLIDCNVPVDSRFNHPDAREFHGTTALHLAAWQGHTRVVRALLDAKASVDLRDNTNATPLCLAVKEGQSEICQMLLKAGATPRIRGPGLSPLFMATILGYSDIVKALLDAGASVNDVENVPVKGLTPLHPAAESGHAEVISILIAAGAHINACTTEGHTPLHQAALLGHVEAINLLTNAGADIDIKSQIGETPLDVAMKNHHREAARAIWQAGGSFTALVKIGEETFIQQVSTEEHVLPIIEEL